MQQNAPNLRRFLPHGSLTIIAKRVRMSRQAVARAINRNDITHPAVKEALKMAEDAKEAEAKIFALSGNNS